jgi:hypothetical protein
MVAVVDNTDFVSFTKILRLLLAFKLERVFARHSMELTRHIFKLSFSLFSILLVNSALLHMVEVDQNYGILDYYYFMIVTMSTVGFGDIVPITFIGRFSIIASILIFLAIIPG